MKLTKIMLAVIATFILTWMLLAFIGYCLSDSTFKDCAKSDGAIMLMLIFGWIPAVFVGMDVDEYLDS
jgi:hypothetical protein